MKLLQVQKRNMAWAGIVLTVYLIFHMLSNLSFFASQDFTAFYAAYNNAYIRYAVLAIVIAALLMHVRTAIRIRRHNSRARTISYKKHDKVHIPASLVTLSITLLFAFIAFHIWQTLNMNTAMLYQSVTTMFHSIWMLIIYFAGLSIMAFHMQHALANVLQTLGITSRTYIVAVTAAVFLLFLGFVSVPVSIYMGWV